MQNVNDPPSANNSGTTPSNIASSQFIPAKDEPEPGADAVNMEHVSSLGDN